MKSSISRRGVTLVEIMVVIAVISILAVIIVPTIAGSRERALSTDDLTRLRQLGVAHAAYGAAHDDAIALGTAPLVALGHAPAEICASKRDWTKEGLANVMAKERTNERGEQIGRETKYKNSFIGPANIGWSFEQYSEDILAQRNPGWLVNMVAMKGRVPLMDHLVGKYQRLLLDGSVQTRSHDYRSVRLDDGSLEKGLNLLWLFYDPPDGVLEG